MKRYFWILLPCMTIAGPAIAETTTFVCSYPTYSDSKGNHKAEDEFKLTFVIDRETEKAYLIGNNGSSNVILIERGDQITFLEATVSGNVMTTTINAELSSVHSRNSVLFGELMPSQYYGQCESR